MAVPSTIQAFWDTTVHKSSDEWVDLLSGLYFGVVPSELPKWATRGILHAAAFAPRPTPGILLYVLAQYFSMNSIYYHVTLDSDHTLLNETSIWVSDDVGKWFIIDGRIVWAEGLDAADSSKMYLIQQPLGLVSAPWWSTQETNKIAWKLPFRIVEPTPNSSETYLPSLSGGFTGPYTVTYDGTPATYVVQLYKSMLPHLSVPPTYEQNSPNLTPSTMPKGGQLLTDPLTDVGNPLGSGPFPLYIPAEDVFPQNLSRLLGLFKMAGYQIVVQYIEDGVL